MSTQTISTQRIVISAYTVEFVDLRESKPRRIQTETVTYNEKALAGLDAMGVDRINYIESCYAQEGYKVLSINKAPRRVVYVDIADLYRQAQRRDAEKDLTVALAEAEKHSVGALDVNA